MKEIVKLMMEGWCIHANQPITDNPQNDRSLDECMVEAVAGTPIEKATDEQVIKAGLLTLFGHWSNDIQGFAAHLGLQMVRDGNKFVVGEVPPAPSVEHWWDEQKQEWIAPEPDEVNGPVEAS